MRAPHFLAAVCLAAGITQQASALSIGLDFITAPTTDMFSVALDTADYSPYGFTTMTTLQVQEAILNAVSADYLGYPTGGASPLLNGLQLDIDFFASVNGSGPTNGDPEYYLFLIGNGTGSDSFLGQACLACVRTSTGSGPTAGTGAKVGSILVNNIASLANLASNDTQRINLLAGTVAHEIGHTLSLEHPPGPQTNPGESTYDLMGTGASPTTMPNSERVKDRAFAYSQVDQLIDAIGTRDDLSQVPEPAAIWLSGIGLVLVCVKKRAA